MKVIHDNVYFIEWSVYKGGTLQAAINNFAKAIKATPWQVIESKYRAGHFTAYDTSKNGCLWFKDKKPDPSIVAHECFHAVHWLVDRIGDKISEDNEEFCAYYLQFLVREVIKI